MGMKTMQGCQLMPGAAFHVAIDNKGLWPNLFLLPGGDIGAFIYNHPSHGYGSNSDIEMWTSADGGVNWQLRSRVSSHDDDPAAIRMNHAAGLNARGEPVVLVSGYQEGQRKPLLPLQCCVSPDSGLTWQRHCLPDLQDRIPYGRILCLPDGMLACPFYRVTACANGMRKQSVEIFESRDGGQSWALRAPLADNANETYLLRLRSGSWLASCRMAVRDPLDNSLPHGSGERLFRSGDEGRTWDKGRPVSPQGQENAHLLELHDGRLLYSFTSRIPGLFGVVYRMSRDEGQTWSLPVVLISIPARDWLVTDCGYPSSVQLPDRTIVTAYYFGPKQPGGGLPWHDRYHMGVARWKPDCWPDPV